MTPFRAGYGRIIIGKTDNSGRYSSCGTKLYGTTYIVWLGTAL
jgi:hypothetical protein